MSLIKPQLVEILNANDYIELFGEPDQEWTQEKQEILDKWIKQAINQFDSLVSPDNQAGALYDWWVDLDLTNPKEQLKAQKLQYAICAWVEFIILTGKYWVDNVPTIQSNIPFNIKSASNNNEIENKRQDIINDLKTIGLLKTNNLTVNENSNNQINQDKLDDLMIVSKEYLDSNYLRLEPQRQLDANLDMGANNIQNVSNIYSSQPFNKGDLYNFQLKNCIVRKDDNNIIDANSAEQAKTILDPIDNIYKQINQFDSEYFGGLSKEKIYELIHASGTDWNPNLEYDINYIVCYIENGLMKFYKSKINDNIGHNPATSPNEWEQLQNQPIDISGVMNQLKPHIEKEINKQLKALPTIEYHSEGNGEILEFETQQDFENYKTAMGVDNSYFQDVQVQAQKDYAVRNERNVFTQQNQFDNLATFKEVVDFKREIIVRGLKSKNSYSILESKNDSLIVDINNKVNQANSLTTKEYVDNKISAKTLTQDYKVVKFDRNSMVWKDTKYYAIAANWRRYEIYFEVHNTNANYFDWYNADKIKIVYYTKSGAGGSNKNILFEGVIEPISYNDGFIMYKLNGYTDKGDIWNLMSNGTYFTDIYLFKYKLI